MIFSRADVSEFHPCSSMYFAIVSVDASPVEQTKYPDDQNINTAKNILRVGQNDCYGEEIKSQATGDLGLNIPPALQKMTDKIERSDICLSVSHGSRQAARPLVVQQLTVQYNHVF